MVACKTDFLQNLEGNTKPINSKLLLTANLTDEALA